MRPGILYQAAPAHGAPPRLKLGLDQHNGLPLPGQQPPDMGQHQPQRNEGHIAGGKVRRFWKLLRPQKADVRLLQIHHPGVLPQRRGQLIPAHIHCIDPLCAPFQRTLGKSAGGGAHI